MAENAADLPAIGAPQLAKHKPSRALFRKKGIRTGRVLCALALGTVLAACQTTQTTYEPPVTVPERFSASGDAVLPDEWWRSLDDPVLNDLMVQALSDNLTVRAAWDRLAQARATARKSGADLYPTLDGEAGAGRQRQKSNNKTTSTTDLSVGLSSSYEIDLWGELRSARDADLFDLDASKEDVKTAAITLSAEVATTWYQLIEQYGQIDLLQSQAETNEKVLDIVTLQFRQGQTQASDVLQQRRLVESTRGNLILASTEAKLLEHQLAILLGRAPNDLTIPRINALLTLPPLPDTGVPAELVNRRPDIRTAYFSVLAADRRTAAAVADRFPQLSLTANVSTSGERIRDLFDNWLASLAANLVAPLFDAGQRKAEVDRTRAVTSEALADYGQTVLEALGEVEDALVGEDNHRKYISSLERQIELSDQASERIRDNYVGGDKDYLDVLDSLLTVQSLEQTYLEAQRRLIEYRIELCRALAGGWEMSAPADPVLATQREYGPATISPTADDRRGG